MKTKNISFIALSLLILLITACNSNTKKNTNEPEAAVVAGPNYISVDSLFANSGALAGKTIEIQGLVDHVCRHSGKRFKLVGNIVGNEIKIELGEQFPVVEQSITGKTAFVRGKLVGEPYNAQQVKEWIEHVKTNHKGEENTDHYKAEIAGLETILAKIESGEIPFYTVYNIDAEKYEIK